MSSQVTKVNEAESSLPECKMPKDSSFSEEPSMDMDTDERYLVAPTFTSRQVKLNFTNEEKPLSVKHQISKISAAPQPLSSISSSGLKYGSKGLVRTEASTFIE